MDKYSEMSPAVRKAAIVILERASEEFSNHGCTDFDLVNDAGLSKKEALEVLQQMHEWDDGGGDKPKAGDSYTNDWLFMNFLAAMLATQDAVEMHSSGKLSDGTLEIHGLPPDVYLCHESSGGEPARQWRSRVVPVSEGVWEVKDRNVRPHRCRTSSTR